MYKKSRLKGTNIQTPFSYLVFIVWHIINKVRKVRGVVDIRGFNNLIDPNAYLIPL